MSVSPAGRPSVFDGAGRRIDRRLPLSGAPECSAVGGDSWHSVHAWLAREMLGLVWPDLT